MVVVVSAKEMVRVEQLDRAAGASEEAFMAAAGEQVALGVERFQEERGLKSSALFLCAKGNNSGDGYAAAFHLLKKGWEVWVLQLTPMEEASPLCRKWHEVYLQAGGTIRQVSAVEKGLFPSEGIIVDALFGTGFHGSISGLVGEMVDAANCTGLPIIAIDIPSGVNGETGAVEGPAIQATLTLFLEQPKSGYFFREGWNHVGELEQLHFGLSEKAKKAAKPIAELVQEEDLPSLPPIQRNRNKYQAGVVVGLAGSPGMPGASNLASLAALRTGAGLVRLLHPVGMEVELATSPYELIKIAYHEEEAEKVLQHLNEADAVFIGPGLGRTPAVKKLLQKVVPSLEVPLVLDADGLFWLAEGAFSLPKQTILTPHKGEMERLLKGYEKGPLTLEFMEQCRLYAKQKGVTLLLKGGPTFLFESGKLPRIITHGSPGMATAGSGDVLTGILAALLAQGCSCWEAVQLGATFHGLAGEFAAAHYGVHGMIAGDIIEELPYVIED